MQKPVGRIDFAGWLFRLFTWDGLLPSCVMFLPVAVERFWPNKGAIEAGAVVLPIVFFFVRIVAGCRRIDSNHCRPWFQKIQVWSMVFAVFILVFLDAFIILSDVLGAPARGDILIIAVIMTLYLVPMAIAMYPGRSNSLDERL
jgi:hypothetical protein